LTTGAHAAALQRGAPGAASRASTCDAIETLTTIPRTEVTDTAPKRRVPLNVPPDDEQDVEFTFKPDFLRSNWKHFHDAVQYHSLFIVHDLLPRVGLCAS